MNAMSCSTTRRVASSWSRTLRNRATIASTSRWATPEEGSSSRTTDGCRATTPARSTKRREPVDSSLTRLSAKRVSPNMSRSSATRRETAASVRTRAGSRSTALKGSPTSVKRSSETASASRTVRPEKRRESWNERPRPSRARAAALRSVTSTPPSSIRPESGTQKAGHDVEERRLAGAVRADDADDLAVACVQGDVTQGGVPTEAEGQAPDLELGPDRLDGRCAGRLRCDGRGRLLDVDRPQELGVGGQLLAPSRRSGPDHRLHDVDAVGHRHGDVHRLLDEQDGGSGVAHGLDGSEELLDDDGGQPERELVDEEQLGSGDGGHGQGQHLLLATGEVARALGAAGGEGGEGSEGLVDHVGVVLAPAPSLPGRGAQVVLRRAGWGRCPRHPGPGPRRGGRSRRGAGG